MGGLYQRFPVTIERGAGSLVWDTDGREYIDCMGGYGVALAGHRNARIVEAVRAQLDRITTVHSSLYSRTREEFLERLVRAAPGRLSRVHLNNSGAESVEAAIKFARKFTGRSGMVAMRGSYHGKSMGALSLTFNPKYRKSFQPLLDHVSFSPFGDADAIHEAVGRDTAFVIIEPIQGESGIHVPPDGFVREARRACDENGALLIFDEIQSGLGRTGRMWASEHEGVEPDIMCLAKGIAGGIPMGATLVRPDVLECISKGEHSSTFGGNPLSCAAGTATLRALTEDGLVSNAGSLGAEFIRGLEDLQERHRIIREVRGRGLMIGVELKFEVRNIIHDAIKEGVLLLYSGRNILRLLPPLVLTRDEMARVLAVLDDLLSREEGRRNVA